MFPRAALTLLVLAMVAAGCTGDAPTDAADTSADQTADAADTDGGDAATADVEGPTEEPEQAPPPPTAEPVPPPERVYEGEAVLTFTDVTDQAGVGLLHESPLDDKEDGRRFMGGAAAGDLDNDGFTDLFVIGGGNTSDALYRNNGDGTFTDVAEAAGVAEPHVGAGVTMADYDGDGDLDLYVTSHGPPEAREAGRHRLFRNNGDLTFTDVAAESGVATSSVNQADGFGAAFTDYDLDGTLDLFVAGWRRDSDGNRLFHANGDGTFTDVTEEAGIMNEGVRGFGPCWTDLNGDRYPDLLLIADFGTTQVYLNRTDGTFVESRANLNVALGDSQAMGTTVTDVNNDGFLDWYVTAIHDDDDVGRGLGNMLFMGQPDGTFVETGDALGVDDGGWGWGTVDVDLNHDGWVDFVETNGWSLPSYENEMAKVFISDAGASFEEVAAAVGLDHDVDGLSVVRFDMDNDGDQDIAITAANERFRLYRNDLNGGGTSWTRVFLDTTGSSTLAPGGYGSRVIAEVGDQRFVRPVDGCANYLSSNEPSVHLGLGEATSIDTLTVEWADGTSTVLTDVPANETLVVTPTDG